MHLPRPTIRLRLTIIYGSLFLISGAALLAITYFLVSSVTGNPEVITGSNGQTSVVMGGAGGQTQIFVGQTTGAGFGDPSLLQTVATQQHESELNQLLIWSMVALAIMAVVSVGLGWTLAGRVLRPLREMASDVRQISATNLHLRLAPAGPDDELHDLGLTFDDLLSRLERSFEAQRQFVANASHELRSPLTRQRTLIQVALDDPEATVDSMRAACERVLLAEDQQETLIEALLTLARSERGLESRELVDLGAVVERVLRSRDSAVESMKLRLDVRLAGAMVSGDPQLIDRLVTNLVDNAIRHNQEGGNLEISTAVAEGNAALRVANTGPVLAESEVERLSEPFKRGVADRTGHGGGWGLGLSIVRAIAEAHGATLTMHARPSGGLDVELQFPSPAG